MALRVLTLNLHCWQEEDALAKLQTVARVIAAQAIDVVMLQEAAQHKNADVVGELHGVAIKKDNAARIIVEHLRDEFSLSFDYAWDWAHLGWDVWEEGLAVLTRGRIVDAFSEWITESKSLDDWLSRKALFADIEIDDQQVRVASTHLGWWNHEREPFINQFIELHALCFPPSHTTLLAGDFNVAASTDAYNFMMNHEGLIDCWLECNPAAMLEPTIGGQIDGWQDGDPEGMRIDYVLIDERSPLRPVSAHTVFGPGDYGVVSDHLGVVVDFEGRES